MSRKKRYYFSNLFEGEFFRFPKSLIWMKYQGSGMRKRFSDDRLVPYYTYSDFNGKFYYCEDQEVIPWQRSS